MNDALRKANAVKNKDWIDAQEYKSIVSDERSLQIQIEEYVRAQHPHLVLIRIPDEAYKLIFSHPTASRKRKGICSKYLKGLPDLLLLNPIKSTMNILNFALCLEIKTKKGKLSQGQKNFAKKANVKVIRSFEDGKNIIDVFAK